MPVILSEAKDLRLLFNDAGLVMNCLRQVTSAGRFAQRNSPGGICRLLPAELPK
jgi:hypothetical protein